MDDGLTLLARMITSQEEILLGRWRDLITEAGGTGGGRVKDAELRKQCRDFLSALAAALDGGAG